jgi:hypothetical protein
MTKCPSVSQFIGRTCVMAASLVCVLVLGCDSAPQGKIYGADPITAWVADAETGKPIEGANVLALWEMKYGLENHGTNYAMVLETVTDAEGKFSLPGWGPQLVLKSGGIETGGPRLTIFKSGYRVGGGANEGSFAVESRHMTSGWNGKVLELTRFLGTDEEYSAHLHQHLQGTIDSLFYNGCNARSFPAFLTSVDKQARTLETQIPNSRLLNLKRLSDGFRGICGEAAYLSEGQRR